MKELESVKYDKSDQSSTKEGSNLSLLELSIQAHETKVPRNSVDAYATQFQPLPDIKGPRLEPIPVPRIPQPPKYRGQEHGGCEPENSSSPGQPGKIESSLPPRKAESKSEHGGPDSNDSSSPSPPENIELLPPGKAEIKSEHGGVKYEHSLAPEHSGKLEQISDKIQIEISNIFHFGS